VNSPVHICGAGPAGLAAAITIAKRGGKAVVHEHHGDVGMRFHGDFQGIENWTVEGDVLEELRSVGIDSTFEHTPIREMVIYDPLGCEHHYRSPEPLFYLVRRGPQPGSLDASLKGQALASGVEILFRHRLRHLPEGGIVAHGPRGLQAIAVGYVFETEMADGVFGAASDQLAPKGYAYLLVNKGRGTVASMIFRDYRAARIYLDRTVEFFRRKAGLRMKNERRFGGIGNFLPPRTRPKGNILFVGEGGGFQDALWGFGLRYAMLSGHLAAKAALSGVPEEYDRLWRQRLGGALQAGFVNRYAFEKLGNVGYPWLLRLIDRNENFREWLRLYYGITFWKRLTYPLARRVGSGHRMQAEQCSDATYDG
jgi:flavin-dependent dehydrogenase